MGVSGFKGESKIGVKKVLRPLPLNPKPLVEDTALLPRLAASLTVLRLYSCGQFTISFASTLGRSHADVLSRPRSSPTAAASPQEPVELAHFSKTRKRGNEYDNSQLKRYMRPSLPCDLSEGYETFRDRDRGDSHPADVTPIFESLRRAGRGLDERELAAADVLTWRGNFAKVLATPWNTRDTWHMEAELVHGVTVLNVVEPEENVRREAKRQGHEARMCYWGFSFEEQCTGGSYDQPIDCLNSFCTVVRTGVGRHRLIMGGEVDCWDGERQGLAGYIELKTTRVMDSAPQVARFERDKLLKWWAQSFSTGVRRILVGKGGRNPRGRPRLSRRSRRSRRLTFSHPLPLLSKRTSCPRLHKSDKRVWAAEPEFESPPRPRAHALRTVGPARAPVTPQRFLYYLVTFRA